MKVRESGMPDEETWRTFFDADCALKCLGCEESCRDVAEFGSGYGTFTVAAARRVTGTVYAFDIDSEMIRRTTDEVRRLDLANVVAAQRDFLTDGTGLPDQSCDYAMLFNILHLEEPIPLLAEARRILRPGGRVGVIHWKRDPSTPRGPSMEIRPSPEQCARWAEAAGLGVARSAELACCPHHFGLVLERGLLA